MRTVVVSEFVSLDGVAEEPARLPVQWDDDVMDAHGARAIEKQDAVILGRRTFEEWAPYWPSSPVEPFASFINAVDKYVASSTELEHDWAHARRIEADLVDFVRELKGQPGGDIGVAGSLSVVRALLAAELVDELKLVVLPALAGPGRRLLDGPSVQQLELTHSERTPAGNLLLDYRFVR